MINQINLDDLMTARSVIGYTIQSQFQSINKASDEVIKILCDVVIETFLCDALDEELSEAEESRLESVLSTAILAVNTFQDDLCRGPTQDETIENTFQGFFNREEPSQILWYNVRESTESTLSDEAYSLLLIYNIWSEHQTENNIWRKKRSQSYYNKDLSEPLFRIKPLVRALSKHLNEGWAVRSFLEIISLKRKYVDRPLNKLISDHVIEFVNSMHTMGMAQALIDEGLINPIDILNDDALINSPKSIENRDRLEPNPFMIEYWITLDVEHTLEACENLIRNVESSKLLQISDAIDQALEINKKSILNQPEQLRGLALILAKRWEQEDWLERTLERRRHAEICWRTLQVSFPEAFKIDIKSRNSLMAEALQTLRDLSRAIKESEDQGASSLSGSNLKALFSSSYTLLYFKQCTLWQVIKPLLLAFRELRERSVPHDLSVLPPTLNEDQLPSPWFQLPKVIMTRLHSHLTVIEEYDDPRLKDFRKSFAEYLIDRLKPKRKIKVNQDELCNEHMVEPNPIWRRFYSLALTRLYVNPGGRGHKTLNFSASFDPDLNVREQSKETYQKLRNDHTLPKKASPRRVILEVMWYLRYAHLESLGEEVQLIPAKNVLRKEFRYNLSQNHQ
jgi:hypothetical protein